MNIESKNWKLLLEKPVQRTSRNENNRQFEVQTFTNYTHTNRRYRTYADDELYQSLYSIIADLYVYDIVPHDVRYRLHSWLAYPIETISTRLKLEVGNNFTWFCPMDTPSWGG